MATAALTARQQEIMDLLCAGLTTAQIARRLFISPHTLKHHLDVVTQRLGAQTRVQAAVLYATAERAPSSTPQGSSTRASLGHAVTLVPYPHTPEERFWAWVQRGTEDDACWIWHGPCVQSSAGPRPVCDIKVLRAELGSSAWRIAYCLGRGVRLPAAVLVSPACPRGNRRCVNPDHLRTGPRGDAPQWRHWQVNPSQDESRLGDKGRNPVLPPQPCRP